MSSGHCYADVHSLGKIHPISLILQQRAAADFFKARIEQEFDLNEFLEGAKDAFWMTHRLIGEENFELLKTMVSSKLLNALEMTGKEYRSAGLVWRTEMDPIRHPIEAQLRGVSIWSRDEMKEFDPERASEATPDDSDDASATEKPEQSVGSGFSYWARMSVAQKNFVNKFLVVTVKFQTEQSVVITREEVCDETDVWLWILLELTRVCLKRVCIFYVCGCVCFCPYI